MSAETTGTGLACPACGSPDSFVVDSRPVNGQVRRRRRCERCDARYTTYEAIAPAGLGPGSFGIVVQANAGFEGRLVAVTHGQLRALRSLMDRIDAAFVGEADR